MVAFEILERELSIALKLIFDKTVEIIKQPVLDKSMLWILLPILTALFLMELYFGRYKKEELGWNSAVSNSIILFFVGMSLCYFLYTKNLLVGLTSVPKAFLSVATKKTFIAFLIILESVFLLMLNFFHLVSKKFAFGISSALIMNFLGAIAIVLVYSNISIDLIIIPAILVLFIFTVIFFLFVRALQPKIIEEDEEELEEEEDEFEVKLEEE